MYQKREERKKKKETEKSFPSVGISWYPGHMVKTKRQIKEDINLIDVVVELLDARIPLSSQNPDIKELVKNKKRIVLLNKSDLADKSENLKWVKYFKTQGIPAVLSNANNGNGIKELLVTIENLMKEELERQAAKGRVGKSIRVMILGIPNVGKSSLINKVTNKKSAQVGNKPGVTKQKQWIKLSTKIDLLDTPGVLWPKFESQEVGLNLSYVGTIKDEILEKSEIVYNLLKKLKENYMENLIQRYKFSLSEYESKINEEPEKDSIICLLELIAQKRGVIKQGNTLDIDKICGIILEEFRSGKLGNITLEKC